MRRLRLACIVVAAGVAGGCLQADTLVKVKADGSGTIEQTVLMSQNAMGMMAAMGQTGDQKSQASPVDQFFKESSFREAAEKLGPGVRFVSMQPATIEGMKGVKALYAFDDITKVQVSQGSSVPNMGEPESEPDAPKDTKGAKDSQIRFDLQRRAGGALLTIKMPEPESQQTATTPSQAQPMPPEAMSMVQMMLKGMKVRVAIEVAGRIVKTDAAYHNDTTVTLLEVDMDTLMQDPAMMQALQGKLRPGASAEELQAAFRGMKGVKMSGPVVNVEWR